MPILKMSLSIQRSISEMKLDPGNVQTLNEANLIRNLYSRLVEFNNNGELVTAAAASFVISNKDLIFTVREDLRSSSGQPLSAEDFYLSLKRLLVLDKNTHGDLKNILCRTGEKVTMESPCEGLSYTNNKLLITPADSNRIKYILPLLASVDFSVIPKNSIDWSSSDLSITNYQNTSGAYYVHKDFSDNDKTLVLKANPNSFYFAKNIPQQIEIISATKDQASSLFLEKKLDYIPTSYSWNGEMLDTVNDNSINTHETFPIKLWATRFTVEGLRKSTSEERKFIGENLKAKFSEIYPHEKVTYSNEMFPKLSEGSLSLNELATLDANKNNDFKIQRKIKLGVPKGELDKFHNALKDFDWIELMELVRAPWTLEPSQQPDCYITFGDSSFFEDLSLISNQMSMGTFNLSKSDGIKWMQDYLNIEDKPKRLTILRELHLNTLKNSYIVPIGFTNFYSFSQNKWKLNFSKYYVGNPFWQIKWNP